MDKLERLERVTERLMRRASNRRASALITPYPISSSVVGEKVEGPILRYMFPCDGVITKAMIRLEAKPKKWVSFNLKVFNETNSSIKGFTNERKLLSLKPVIEVKAGDCLEVSIVPSPEDVVKEVWISFLWVPAMKDVDAKSFLITELENDLSERKKELIADEVLSG